ncbi:MAG: glycerol-3-phosphate dehydrogenase [Hellea sp.]|nr:glycerol-3-phosphate dehydrogenase [Hellea sp.]
MVDQYDMLIVGGGINGTAIARDASGRGLNVLLCEKDDLASHTSSSSTKLIHGGLRYLEYYEFRLVREALIEREVLLRSAPHIIWPMRFVLPYDEGLRPAWMLRLGLFLYDSLGGRKELPGTKTVKLDKAPHAGVLEERLVKGFEYSDCWVEDARLVVLNAIDAKNRGADIKTRAFVSNIERSEGGYRADVTGPDGVQKISARCIVNTAGPWVDEILMGMKGETEEKSVRLVKGSHIVTKKLFEGDHAYIFQNQDNRIIFAIPYEQDYTLIGTTDVPYAHADGPVKISQGEIEYLCDAANEYFKNDITPDDVTWTYSGVRPLYDDKAKDASAVTRDYVLNIDEFTNDAPFLSVYGGKITTSRKLAEHAMDKLAKYFPKAGDRWTKKSCLPGGDIGGTDFDDFFEALSHKYDWMPAGLLRRLAHGYGNRIHELVGEAASMKDMGKEFGEMLTERELKYLIDHEWVQTAEDALWRRTKLGVHLTKSQIGNVEKWFKANV